MATRKEHAAAARKERERQRRQNQIRVRVNRLRRLRLRIKQVSDLKPAGWEKRVARLREGEEKLLAELKRLGWKPRTPNKPADGADAPADPDAALPAEPAEPDPGALTDAEILAQLEEPDGNVATTDGNWIYGHGESDLGADPSGKPFKPFAALKKLLPKAGWSKPVALTPSARLQTQPGTRAMVVSVKPGLFVVQLVPEDAVKQLAGDEVGVIPLLLPGIAQAVTRRFAQVPPPAQGQPGGPGYVPPQPTTPPAAPPPSTGCDACNGRCGRR